MKTEASKELAVRLVDLGRSMTELIQMGEQEHADNPIQKWGTTGTIVASLIYTVYRNPEWLQAFAQEFEAASEKTATGVMPMLTLATERLLFNVWPIDRTEVPL